MGSANRDNDALISRALAELSGRPAQKADGLTTEELRKALDISLTRVNRLIRECCDTGLFVSNKGYRLNRNGHQAREYRYAMAKKGGKSG